MAEKPVQSSSYQPPLLPSSGLSCSQHKASPFPKPTGAVLPTVVVPFLLLDNGHRSTLSPLSTPPMAFLTTIHLISVLLCQQQLFSLELSLTYLLCLAHIWLCAPEGRNCVCPSDSVGPGPSTSQAHSQHSWAFVTWTNGSVNLSLPTKTWAPRRERNWHTIATQLHLSDEQMINLSAITDFCLHKVFKSWTWWCTFVIPATQEVEARELWYKASQGKI
jgi:hypothetical protein